MTPAGEKFCEILLQISSETDRDKSKPLHSEKGINTRLNLWQAKRTVKRTIFRRWFARYEGQTENDFHDTEATPRRRLSE